MNGFSSMSFSGSTEYTEVASPGVDNVVSCLNWTLGPSLENLTLSGTGNTNATGNELVNKLTGNAGNNILNRGAGVDTMLGGAGNDTYMVDATGDIVTELASEGADTVMSSAPYTLSANVENLTLTSAADINATGNADANVLTGYSGNNILNGGAGADTMAGGAGNDTYLVDNLGDVLTEALSAGTDLVQSSVAYTLTTNVENLTLTGMTAINGTSNALDNIVTGNSAANVLTGGSGDYI